MPEITNMTRQNVRILNEAVAAALAGLEAEFGVDIQVGGGKFDPAVGTFNPKITIKVAGASANSFAAYCDMYGLEISDHGREFTSQGRRFRVDDISPRSPRRPIICIEISTGRTFKFEATGLVRILRREDRPALTQVDVPRVPAAASGATEYALIHEGVTVKVSKSRASLLTYKSRKGLIGATIVEVS